MAKQGLTLNVQDGGLGQTPLGLGNVEVVIGCCSGPASPSTVAFYTPLQTANPSVITSTLGYGDMPELACLINQSTGNPVICIPVPAAVPGNLSVGPIANSGNASTAPIILQGTPQDEYYGIVQVSTACTIGTSAGQITISLDNNRTTFATINIPSNYAPYTPLAVTAGGVTTGLTVQFGPGALSLGDKWYFITDGPLWSDAAIASAIQSLYNWNQSTPQDIFVTGGSALRNGPGTAGCSNGDVTSFDAQMTALFNKAIYMRLICAAGDAQWGGTSTETEATWMSSIVTAHQNDSSLRVGVAAGNYNCISAISQTQFRRSLEFFAAARDAAVAIQVDLGRVKDGALASMVIPTTPDTGFMNSSRPFIYHDETLNPGLDAARFMSAWSIARKPGLFIKNPNLMAPPGSDFNWLQHGHVMDATCLIVYDFFVNELSDNVLVYPSGTPNAGQILQTVSQDLTSRCYAQINEQLIAPGALSGATVTIPGGQNLLSTATLNVNVSIVPPGYLKAIVITLQFQNPAVVQVQSAT